MAVAVCYETPTKFVRYTVADGIGIPKGTILALTTANYASACTADDDTAAGIAWMEKVASDGSTEITAARNGTWGITSSTAGPCTVGYDAVVTGVNALGNYTTLDDEKGYVYGKFLETIGSSVAALCKMRLDV